MRGCLFFFVLGKFCSFVCKVLWFRELLLHSHADDRFGFFFFFLVKIGFHPTFDMVGNLLLMVKIEERIWESFAFLRKHWFCIIHVISDCVIIVAPLIMIREDHLRGKYLFLLLLLLPSSVYHLFDVRFWFFSYEANCEQVFFLGLNWGIVLLACCNFQ